MGVCSQPCGGVSGVMLGGWWHCVSVSRVLGQAMDGCSQPCGGSGRDDVGWLVSLCLSISGTRGSHGCLQSTLRGVWGSDVGWLVPAKEIETATRVSAPWHLTSSTIVCSFSSSVVCFCSQRPASESTMRWRMRKTGK